MDQTNWRTATTEDVLTWRDRAVEEASQHFAESRVDAAAKALGQLSLATIDARTLESTDPFLAQLAGDRKIIATFDSSRIPADDEVVIIYGNYPHMFGNVVVNNPIRRHVADFWSFRHDAVEYDRRWDGVGQIFIINVDTRRDRYDSALRELASAGAPFQRVTRVPAQTIDPTDSSKAGGAVACLRSHIDTLRRAHTAQLDHVLVLEDDFCFTSDLDEHLNDLRTFLTRSYDYWVCLVATSKYGPIAPKDDILSTSFQRCTNAGGYFVSREGLKHVLPVFEQALVRLKETSDVDTYAADRCWTVLQESGRFLVFRRKFGFQVSSFSDIERRVSRYLD
jgi:hypothetical protein